MLELDVRKRLGRFELDAQLCAPKGITTIFGPSGSGKTSLINIVSGIIDADDGAIRLNNRVLFDKTTSIAASERNIGYVFQDARLFPHMSVLQNLRYGGRKDEERLVGLLELEPLLSRRSKQLSGGEKQRVALARPW